MDGNCIFCDRANFEERLIAERPDWYVVATLGQITDGGYVLMIPKAHVPCIGALAADHRTMAGLMDEVRSALVVEYPSGAFVRPCSLTAFEHGIVGQTIPHAHLHLLPVAVDLTPRIRSDFPSAELGRFRDLHGFQARYQRRPDPYLLWTTPSDELLACWAPDAPRQYLRIVVSELLGRPERGNWRVMDPELDGRLWRETVTRMRSRLF